MKAITRMLLVSMITFLLLASASFAQKKSDEDRTRGLFVNKHSDAMRFVVLRADGKTFVPVSPAEEFKSGDEIKLSFESNFEGYIYVVNVDSDGKKCLLFPYASETNNKIKPEESYRLPRAAAWKFDEHTGTEVLQVIMSREPISYLTAALKNPQCSNPEECCELSASASSAAAEFASDAKKTDTKKSGIVSENIAKVLPSVIRTRDISFAAGRDKDPQGSVVAIPESTNVGGKLNKGEAAVFEIRLKHN